MNLTGARVLDPAAPLGPADLAIRDGRVAAVTPTDRPGPLDGLTITPAFVDAHVHATATGLLVDGLDLTGCPSTRSLLDAVAARTAARPGALVWGHGWQEQGWDAIPTRAELDRAAAGCPVYLSRVDVHSALVSSALLDRAPDAASAAGFADGPLTADAHHHARRAALASVDTRTRDAAQAAFLLAAAQRGVAVVHECAGPEISSVADLAALCASRSGPRVVPYWGEAVGTVEDARALLAATGAHGLAGDLFVDGSLGSRTAALRAPYADTPGCVGRAYLDVGQIAAHLAACAGAGVAAGFHVIGDAAVDAFVAGLLATDPATVTHRVEHLEMVDPAHLAVLAAHGVVASVQPVFDAWWGGPGGMYAARLGDRAHGMNPFAALHAAGVTLAFGSDTPVTPVDPWGAVRAAVGHHTPGSGLDEATALAAHTVGGHRAAGDRSPLAGRLTVGAPATYAVWEGERCLRTVLAGETLHDTGELPPPTPASPAF